MFHVCGATDAQYALSRTVWRADQWVRLGPEGTRAQIDRAIAFGGGQEVMRDEVGPRWTKRLDNRATVRLMAVASPTRWPFCWWDADGRPVSGNWTGIGVTLDAPHAVVVDIEHAPARVPGEAAPQVKSSTDAYVLPATDRRFEVWVGAGPYRERHVSVGDEVVIDGGDELMDGEVAAGENEGIVRFVSADQVGGTHVASIRGDLGPGVEVWLDAVDKSGRRHVDSRERSVHFVASTSTRWQRAVENLDIADAATVDHYVLRWRFRQRAVFEGFATEPVKAPEALTGEN